METGNANSGQSNPSDDTIKPAPSYAPVDSILAAGIVDGLKKQGIDGTVLGVTPDGKIHVRNNTPRIAENIELTLATEDFNTLIPELKPNPVSILELKMPTPPKRHREPFRPPAFVPGRRRR